jgi:hypothetical protein
MSACRVTLCDGINNGLMLVSIFLVWVLAIFF